MGKARLLPPLKRVPAGNAGPGEGPGAATLRRLHLGSRRKSRWSLGAAGYFLGFFGDLGGLWLRVVGLLVLDGLVARSGELALVW